MAIDLDALAKDLTEAGFSEFDIRRHADSLFLFDSRRGHELQGVRVTTDGRVLNDEPDHPALDIIRKHVAEAR